MTILHQFLGNEGTKFGIFYPKNHLVGVFPDMTEAITARRALLNAGFPDRDVIAIPGSDLALHAQELARRRGLWAILMDELSHLIGTEAEFVDEDLKMAADGAAFVVVHAPGERRKVEAWHAIERLAPWAARYYSAGGIETFRGVGSDHVKEHVVHS